MLPTRRQILALASYFAGFLMAPTVATAYPCGNGSCCYYEIPTWCDCGFEYGNIGWGSCESCGDPYCCLLHAEEMQWYTNSFDLCRDYCELYTMCDCYDYCF